MRHARESELRRLGDEPLALPDRVVEHLDGCPRCQSRLAEVTSDAERCARLLGGLQPVPDVDAAWAGLLRASNWLDPGRGPAGSRVPVVVPHRPPRLVRLPLRGGLAAAGAALVLAGTAAAATATTVFAPTHVEPVTLRASDVGALADFMGMGRTSATAGVHGTRPSTGGPSPAGLGGFPTTSGSRTTSFGTVRWSSSGPPHHVATRRAAERAAGFPLRLPTRLPAGVDGPTQFVVQPRVQVGVTFAADVPSVGGSSVQLDAGPAVLVSYRSASGPDLVALGVLTMPRPTATSSGATTRQIEAFLLAQPSLPAELTQEIRLLGDLGTTLPVPVPTGAAEQSVEIAGAPGVLVADPSNAAAGVVWEDGKGVVRAVAGLVDRQDALRVADQLG